VQSGLRSQRHRRVAREYLQDGQSALGGDHHHGLPQELIDRTKSLEACSLVCSQWSPRSRKHLFTQVGFASQRDLQRWCACIRPEPLRPSSLVEDLTLSENHFSHTLPSSPWIHTSTIIDAAPHFQSLFALRALGGSEMVHGYHLRSVDASFIWLLPRKCDTFDTEGCRCSARSPFNPQDVLWPLPASR